MTAIATQLQNISGTDELYLKDQIPAAVSEAITDIGFAKLNGNNDFTAINIFNELTQFNEQATFMGKVTIVDEVENDAALVTPTIYGTGEGLLVVANSDGVVDNNVTITAFEQDDATQNSEFFLDKNQISLISKLNEITLRDEGCIDIFGSGEVTLSSTGGTIKLGNIDEDTELIASGGGDVSVKYIGSTISRELRITKTSVSINNTASSGTTTITFPTDKSGTVALTDDIPDTTDLVYKSKDNQFSGTNYFTGPVIISDSFENDASLTATKIYGTGEGLMLVANTTTTTTNDITIAAYDNVDATQNSEFFLNESQISLSTNLAEISLLGDNGDIQISGSGEISIYSSNSSIKFIEEAGITIQAGGVGSPSTLELQSSCGNIGNTKLLIDYNTAKLSTTVGSNATTTISFPVGSSGTIALRVPSDTTLMQLDAEGGTYTIDDVVKLLNAIAAHLGVPAYSAETTTTE